MDAIEAATPLYLLDTVLGVGELPYKVNGDSDTEATRMAELKALIIFRVS